MIEPRISHHLNLFARNVIIITYTDRQQFHVSWLSLWHHWHIHFGLSAYSHVMQDSVLVLLND